MLDLTFGILKHTPIWVYVLFVFLVNRGIKARRPATVTLEKLLVIPTIFLVWDIYDLLRYRELNALTGTQWIAGIFIGMAIGYLLINRITVRRATEPRTIHRPADHSALPFMMLAFAVKYALGVMSALSPITLQQPTMRAFAIISGGIFAGVFIGKFIRYVRVYMADTAPGSA